MGYSTLSLDFKNKVVVDKTKWKEIWDDCMEPDSFAEYVYIVIENAVRRYKFKHDFEPEIYMFNLNSPYKVHLRLGNKKYILIMNPFDESQLVNVE